MNDDDTVLAELRTFILSYGEHDQDCPGIDARQWPEHRRVCICGFAPRLDELMGKLAERLAR
jgi:hypothetical protein